MISKNLQETVESILENDVKSRDNDMRLIALIWHKELGDLKDLYYLQHGYFELYWLRQFLQNVPYFLLTY